MIFNFAKWLTDFKKIFLALNMAQFGQITNFLHVVNQVCVKPFVINFRPILKMYGWCLRKQISKNLFTEKRQENRKHNGQIFQKVMQGGIKSQFVFFIRTVLPNPIPAQS